MRSAIVTGGTRGIGAAICLELKAAGIQVAATYSNDDATAAEFSSSNSIKSYKWDVADFDACQRGVETIQQEMGPIDILVNNAGVTRDSTIMKMTHADWRKVVDTNLGGCFNMSKAVFPAMRERNWGRIISIGSVNGQSGQFGQANYAAAKSGIQGLTKSLALEGARYGITANVVAPGYVATDMVEGMSSDILASIVKKVPVGRLGTSEEIGAAVRFLCSDSANFVTGSTFSINGGLYMH